MLRGGKGRLTVVMPRDGEVFHQRMIFPSQETNMFGRITVRGSFQGLWVAICAHGSDRYEICTGLFRNAGARAPSAASERVEPKLGRHQVV